MRKTASDRARVRPDAWLDPLSGVRIRVTGWKPLCAVEDQYIERPRSLRLLWAYLRHVGPVTVVRKVLSRRAERVRNRKVVAVGAGIVLATGRKGAFRSGDRVVFLAPNHPQAPIRNLIVNDYRFVRPLTWLQQVMSDPGAQLADPEESVEPWKGWVPFSGVPTDEASIDETFQALAPCLRRLAANPREESVAAVSNSDAGITERIEGESSPESGVTAVIFGLGNYAKTQIVPIVKREMGLTCIHEIDPDQFVTASMKRTSLDSSPLPRADEHYDAWFISGYHHTHAPLAIEALERGAYAVVEKPVATTSGDFERLVAVLQESKESRLFTCFQKRYSKLHEWACVDLGCGRGEPVDMIASIFEIPLPRAHWYNWPVSGSRMISNGCHWLDYFMCVNGYAEVANAEIEPMRGGDLLAVVRLENDARLALYLTDTGSARLGVRELIELRHGHTTARIIDARSYEAENTSRQLRCRNVNPVAAYNRMYREICRRIRAGESGDSRESLRSTALMLRLEEQLRSESLSDESALLASSVQASPLPDGAREGVQ